MNCCRKDREGLVLLEMGRRQAWKCTGLMPSCAAAPGARASAVECAWLSGLSLERAAQASGMQLPFGRACVCTYTTVQAGHDIMYWLELYIGSKTFMNMYKKASGKSGKIYCYILYKGKEKMLFVFLCPITMYSCARFTRPGGYYDFLAIFNEWKS